MSFCLETNVNPDDNFQSLIDGIIYNKYFPWYFGSTANNEYQNKMFFHALMLRENNDENTNIPVRGKVNSEYYLFFEDVFLKICESKKIPVNVILRANINNTYHMPDKHCPIHQDHPFPHKIFLWYLNEFTGAPTYLFDDEDNLIKELQVGKNKVNIFDGQKHAHGYCAPGEFRMALIFTFI